MSRVIGYLMIDDSDGETELFNLAESCKEYMNARYLEFPRLYELRQVNTAERGLSVEKYGERFHLLERIEIPKGWEYQEDEE